MYNSKSTGLFSTREEAAKERMRSCRKSLYRFSVFENTWCWLEGTAKIFLKRVEFSWSSRCGALITQWEVAIVRSDAQSAILRPNCSLIEIPINREIAFLHTFFLFIVLRKKNIIHWRARVQNNFVEKFLSQKLCFVNFICIIIKSVFSSNNLKWKINFIET